MFCTLFSEIYLKSTPFNVHVVPEAINPAVSKGYHFLKNDVLAYHVWD